MERNLTWHNMDIDRTLREQQMGQNACTIWMREYSADCRGCKAHE